MRNKQTLNATPYEDIISYECNYLGRFVKVLIAAGTINAEGIFVPAPNYEYILIENADFDSLMAQTPNKPAKVFRKDDLWEFVDKLRNNVGK